MLGVSRQKNRFTLQLKDSFLSVPFLPAGPQAMVPLGLVEKSATKWKECHRQSFATALYSDNYPEGNGVIGVQHVRYKMEAKWWSFKGKILQMSTIKNKCTKGKVIMACQRVGSK